MERELLGSAKRFLILELNGPSRRDGQRASSSARYRLSFCRIMIRLRIILLTCGVLSLVCLAQDARLADVLSFEFSQAGEHPNGWSGGPRGTILTDDNVVHGGRYSVRLERGAESESTFSTLTMAIPMEFAGAKLELSGFLRTENVEGFAGLWMRQDGDTPSLAFDNMRSRQLRGTTDWAPYSISLPIHPNARQLFLGVLLTGTGKAWADDLRLLVDGKPIWEAPRRERPKSALDLDREYDGGSGVALNEISKAQVTNLITLGKVWGFLKYHHPRVTAGEFHWDYHLFRVLPEVLKAPDRVAGNQILLNWITGLGSIPSCVLCADLDEAQLHLRSDLGWIGEEVSLGADLSRVLRAVHQNRPAGKQFYVSLVRGVGNPIFENERAYGHVKLPDAGFQILALYRFWNIIAYWFPYRDVIGQDWDQVLEEFLPRIALARSGDSYQRELMALIARIHDTHANLWSSIGVRPPTGSCQVPVHLRFIGDQPVVTGFAAADAKDIGLKTGDIITSLGGVPVTKLIEDWTPYYAASNQPTRLRDMARYLTFGDCNQELPLGIRREGQSLQITAQRVPAAGLERSGRARDLPGDTFRLLTDQVAYLKLSSVKIVDAAGYIESAAKTKGLIIDIRNYPSEFMVFALGQRLVDKETEFARFTAGDLSNPGAFHWGRPISLKPQQPHYPGMVIILVDEVSQSQAEYTSMAFRASPRAKVVGSTTAGADGNVSRFALPGGLNSMISGIGVFYPDKRPTQRVGIIPDVEVKPTIGGIIAGRDEVLEAALRLILGAETSALDIENIVRKAKGQ